MDLKRMRDVSAAIFGVHGEEKDKIRYSDIDAKWKETFGSLRFFELEGSLLTSAFIEAQDENLYYDFYSDGGTIWPIWKLIIPPNVFNEKEWYILIGCLNISIECTEPMEYVFENIIFEAICKKIYKEDFQNKAKILSSLKSGDVYNNEMKKDVIIKK